MKPSTDYVRHAARLARKLQMEGGLGGTPQPDAEFYKTILNRIWQLHLTPIGTLVAAAGALVFWNATMSHPAAVLRRVWVWMPSRGPAGPFRFKPFNPASR